tara:strand:+ start:1005 stop:1694 length:690 start_codon:yes stop_codon:yes gene_type:complete
MRQANEKAIGGFVLMAMILTVVAIVYFGTTNLFSIKRKFSLYFSDSINGLEVGASVKFKGVKIGRVEQIVLEVDAKDKTISMPVIIEIDSSNIKIENLKKVPKDSVIISLIKRGLRAKLASQSMVTGQLYIELNMHPEIPAKYKENVTQYAQIPTMPSSSEAITNGLQAGTAALIETRKLMKKANERIMPISNSIEESLGELKETLVSFRVLANYLEQHPESLLRGKGK